MTNVQSQLLAKLSHLHQQFLQLGYSQTEFEQFLLQRMFENKGSNLTDMIKSINSIGQMEKLLKIAEELIWETQSIGSSGMASQQSIDIKTPQIEQSSKPKRKKSDNPKKSKPQKQHKTSNNSSNPFMSANTLIDRTIQFANMKPLISMMEKSNNLKHPSLSMVQDLVGGNEIIYQKLMQIKMLTKMLGLEENERQGFGGTMSFC